eukprot:TRINITY_DN3491_c0_g2_i1.p2 TRINITY_DN3491_c0_g2~~TRINITY_DN3491_c0_g2_i1.p2  ORF type:complete len:580 (-),score=149.14 TRINITY_DN3491_c0_g2_i1:1793-3532(-)
MLDYFVIFTRGGVVLFYYKDQHAPVIQKGEVNPVNKLIQAVLLEERSGQDVFFDGSYALKWTFANDVDLVFVCVYQKLIRLLYVDELLESIKESFVKKYKALEEGEKNVPRFEKKFFAIKDDIEATVGFRGTSYVPKVKKEAIPEPVDEPSDSDDSFDDDDDDTEASSEMPADIVIPKGMRPRGRGPRRPKSKTKKQAKSEPKPPPAKKNRNWKGSSKNAEELNFGPAKKKNDKSRKEKNKPTYNSENESDIINLDYSEESSDDIQPQESTGIFSYFTKLANKVVTAEDLEPVLQRFESHLISKNVATDIANELCSSVAETLIGKNLGTFSRLSSTVKSAMEESLTRILTPNRNVDILREIRLAQENGEIYTMAFVGVNGVGKSTSLAKVTAWLQQQNLSCLIAACDTFRSGAIEQLEVHCDNLNVPLYAKGYDIDPASVAFSAVKHAKREGHDVVLIDTAGRMQNKEPLMEALGKLVSKNNPNLIIFVGEAIVGNDSVDQLLKFNRAIAEHGSQRVPRCIDGIILTKFDTVDEKVGAAISMVYTTGKPILFVGTGQNYPDIKRLNVKRIVQILLKGRI